MTETAQQPSKMRRIPLWAKWLAGVLLTVILLLIAARVIVASSVGRNFVEPRLEALTFSGQQVEIDGFDGDILSSATIDRLVVRDEDGIWAEARNISLGWKPFNLVGRRLVLTDLTMSDLEVLRRPVIPESDTPEEKPSEGTSPLRSVTLSNLDIDRLFMAEGVAQQEVAASVYAALNWTPAMSRFDVEVLPEDSDGDRLVGEVEWGRRIPLSGALELNGPAGGLFASLLQLEDGDSVHAMFDASGDMDAVDATLTARINDQDWIEFETTPSDDLQVVTARVDLARHPATSSQIVRLGDVLDLSGMFALDDPLATATLTAETETMSLTVSDANDVDNSQTANIDFRARDLSRVAGTSDISIDDLSLVGQVQRGGSALAFDGNIAGRNLVLPGFSGSSLSGPIAARFDGGVVHIEPQLEVTGARVAAGEEEVALRYIRTNGVADLTLETMALDLQRLALSTPRSSLNLRGSGSFADGVAINLAGDVRAGLSEFGVYERGVLSGRWELRKNSSAAPAQFRVALNGRGLGEEGSAAYDWLGESVALNANGRIAEDGALTVPSLSLMTSAFELSGTAFRTAEGVLQSSFELVTTESYPFADMAPGTRIRSTVSGPMESLNIEAMLNASELAPGGVVVAQPEFGFTGAFSDGVLDGNILFTGGVEGDPLRLAASARVDGGAWQVSAIDGQWRELVLEGDAYGDGGDLEAIRADTNLAGPLPEGLPAETVNLNARLESSSVAINGVLEGIELGAVQNGELTLDVQGVLEQLRYDIALTGLTLVSGIPQDVDLRLTGEARDLADMTRSVSGEINGQLGLEEFGTTEPFSFAQTETGYSGEIRLTVFGGEVAAALSDNPESRVTASIAAVELPRLLVATGRAPLDGAIDVSVQLRENGDALVGTINGKMGDVALPDSEMSPVTFFLNGVIENEEANIRLRSAEGQALSARFEANLPLITNAAGLSISLDDSREGGFTAALGGRVDNIAALALPDRTVLTGGIDANVTGPIPFQPQALDGYVRMDDGQFEQGELGAVLQAIAFDIGLANETLTLNRLSANGRSGGTLAGQGSFSLTGAGDSNLRLEADNLVLADRYEGRATASGVFGMELNDETIVVTGDLTLDEGHVYLDRLPTSSGVTTLDVSFGDEEAPEVDEERTVEIDVSLNAPRRLYVTGQGMDAELSLESRITGTLSDVRIDGRSDIVRGRFELLGKRFEFVDSVVFLEGAPMEARLDITAERETNDLLSQVNITGTPARPDVSLSSVPELPQDEVLSRVLFGRSPSQLTGLEAARLAAALAQMGGGGGFDLLGGIEQLAGLDALDVRQNDSGQFEVSTGRYLSEDVYLEVMSDAQGNAGVSVEWEPRENISVTADTTPGEGENLTIEWTRDFD